MKEKIMHPPDPSPLLVEFPAGVVQIGCRSFSFLHLDMVAVLELSFRKDGLSICVESYLSQYFSL